MSHKARAGLVLSAFALLAGPAPGAAAAVPTVVTREATEVGPFKATLNATVDPNGSATGWSFEYGTSTAYGSKTATRSAGSGTTPVPVAEAITGLKAGVRYHFRIVASNASGTSKGADATFSTDPPPSVASGSASSIGPNSATLSGSVNPRGRPATFFFEYGTTTAYGTKTTPASAGSGSSSVKVSATVTGLAAGTTYHFRVVASSDAGTTVGDDRAFTTSRRPTVVTGPPSSIAATSAVVTGTVNPNGRSTSWWFEYGTSTSYGTKTSDQSAGSGTANLSVSATLTGLAPGITYHYRLVARNSSGTSRGADSTLTTAAAPSVVTGPPSRISTTSATVSGTVTPNGRPTSWYVEYGRTTGYGLRTASVSAGAGTAPVPVSARLAGLGAGLRYHYRVVGANDAGTTVGDDRSFATAPWPRSPSGRIVRCTITGTQDADVLRGTSRADVICGLGGNDRILGGRGNDVIYGGPGDDIVFGGPGRDVAYGGAGRDQLYGNEGADRLYGGGDANRLYGGGGGDLLVGGPVGDTLIGGRGADRLLGGDGNDVIYARDGARDVVDGGFGRDTATLDGKDVRRSIERRL